MKTLDYEVVVLGGGPAGLAAAISAKEKKANVLLIEREEKLGGILKQCIHDGFGIFKFKERLTGPEYAHRYIEKLHKVKVDYILQSFVINIIKQNDKYKLIVSNSEDTIFTIQTKSLIFATGCRERTDKQIFIYGNRPAGIYTAGLTQYMVNILGVLPGKRCVILGSGDIGLIMARRLTLEGMKVLGVYEIQSHPSGLNRNIAQCLEDYGIPLHFNRTITRINGVKRVSSVVISRVDEHFQHIKGSEEIIECDSVILSVGLLPEIELLQNLNIAIESTTKGPQVDQNLMTNREGVFCCGNSLHVNDLVDFVSESGEIAGKNAANFVNNEKNDINRIKIQKDNNFLYIVPQYISIPYSTENFIFYFRSNKVRKSSVLRITLDNKEIFTKKYRILRPPEMEKIVLHRELFKDISTNSIIKIKLEARQ